MADVIQRGDSPPGQVVRAQRVLESGVGRPRVYQKAVADLADVPKPLDSRGIESQKRGSVEPDVVPEGIADDFGRGEGGSSGRGGRGGVSGQGRTGRNRRCANYSIGVLRLAAVFFTYAP
jgi:hypothetical protein